MKRRSINFRLSEQAITILDRAANRHGVTRSVVFEMLLRKLERRVTRRSDALDQASEENQADPDVSQSA